MKNIGFLIVAWGISFISAFAADTSYVSENTDNDQLISFGEMDGFYRNRRALDVRLANTLYMRTVPDFLCDESLDFPYIRKDSAKVARDGKEIFLADNVILVRLLGGWETSSTYPTVEDAKEQDLFYLNENGEAAYRWNLLYDRIDPLMNRGYSCSNITLVLDNIPYDMVAPEDIGVGSYGQVGIPRDFEQWGVFVNQLCRRLVDRYGEDESNGFRFRIGSEAQADWRFDGSPEDYVKYYDYAAAAVKDVLPEAKVGPFNRYVPGWNSEETKVGWVAEHCAKDANVASGQMGTPFDFVAHSFYYYFYNFAHIRHPDDIVPNLGTLYDEIKSIYGGYKDIPLEMQEFGILGLEGKVGAKDTGARGAAQTLETMVDLKKIGNDRVYHWYISETIPGISQGLLIHGDAWLYMVFDHMRGGQTWKVPFDVTGGSTSNSVETFVSVKDDVTYLLVSCWNVDRKQTEGSTVQVNLPGEVVSFSGTLDVQQILFEETNSVYDVIWEDFRTNDLLSAFQTNYLAEYGKAVTYAHNTMQPMCKDDSEAGRQYIEDNWSRYQQLMTDSLKLTDFSGAVTNTTEGLEVTLTMPTPSVYVVAIREE